MDLPSPTVALAGRQPLGLARRRVTEALLVLVLTVVWLVTWSPRARGPLDLRWDAAVYYILGTSLAQGHGYRLLNEPGEILSIQYPPALPAFVAAHQWALGTKDPLVVGRALRASYFVLTGIYVFAVFLLLRRSFGPLASLAGAMISALGTLFIWVSDRLYSELPFLVALSLFMLAAGRQGRGARAAAAAAAIVAFLLRTVGAALLVSWIVDAAYARQWKRAALRLVIAGLLVSGWQAYVWRVQHAAEYRTPAYEYQRAPYLFYNVSYATNASLKRQFSPTKAI
jgi:hypothetical protein